MMSSKRQRKKPKYLRDDEESKEQDNVQDSSTSTKKSKRITVTTAVNSAKGDFDNPSTVSTTQKTKKHRKNKKHKLESDIQYDQPADVEPPRPGIKLKFKLGGQTVGTSVTTSMPVPEEELNTPESTLMGFDSEDVDIEGDFADGDIGSDNELIIRDKNKDGGETSDEEREWLEAVEAGDLEDYERKKAEKTPSLLTARQRALLHGETEEMLMELPTQYKSTTVTEEQLQRRKQRALKRRQQAIEKREKAKKLTVDRLLKKQESSIKGRGAKIPVTKQVAPHCRYILTQSSVSLSMPPGMDYPLAAYKQRAPKVKELCGVANCNNLRKYSCSKTKVSLCSLDCYKKNLVDCST